MIQFIQNNLMWFWLSVMVVCVLIEALTLALTSVWAAIAALIMIFVSQTGLPFKWQLLLFLVLTIALIVTTRPFAVKKLKLGKNKTNVNSLVGQEVLVVKKISPFQKGEVKAKNGVIWTAQNADPQSSSEISEGTVCTIEKIDGNTLSVKPLS
ncbi:NfeD family protein [uncultured Treponema sp.]|uniref:NfeD family protein n=1 Tax=uncultured Treponema sp. TaxID=162155 RepID=UPI0015BE769B|nr:NfeD family protein [uncultured Treponema sp.]